MTKNLRAGATGLLLCLALAAPASAATVTVRVEGGTTTHVPETTVTTSPDVVVDKTAEGGTTCEGTSGGGALELATGGDWGGRQDSQGQRVERIKGETHLLGTEPGEYDGRYWALYVNNSALFQGICSYVPETGDEILITAGCGGATTECGGEPLELTGPVTAKPGVAFTVHADEWSEGESAPSAGATITGAGAPVTTDDAGNAAVTLTTRGPVTLTADKEQDLFGQTVPRTRDRLTVCVTDGADGFCGTTAPDGTQQPGQPPVADPTPGIGCQTTGDDGLCGTRDRRPAQARITGIEEGQRFTRKRAPRTLTATVEEDPNGLSAVKLGLSRKRRGRCWVFSGKRERFRRAKCGHHANFRVGDRAEVSYLLPRRLPRGRYVLDVIAIDGAFNRDRLARGRNRVVFTVR